VVLFRTDAVPRDPEFTALVPQGEAEAPRDASSWRVRAPSRWHGSCS